MNPTPPILVSACLAGSCCRYDGDHRLHKQIADWVQSGLAIAVCPEELGGLPTPRACAEIQPDGRVLTDQGQDVSAQYQKGAELVADLAKKIGISKAYLKNKSPMCGAREIYDGSFKGRLQSGDGVLAKRLRALGIEIFPV